MQKHGRIFLFVSIVLNGWSMYAQTGTGTIEASPAGDCEQGYVLDTQVITYTIRFQNTGTAPVVNMSVRAPIDADLDIASFNLLFASHTMFTQILPGNVLKFRFDNINLPDSTTSPSLSQGYITYSLKPNMGTSPYTEISGNASIYFDSAAVVFTNTIVQTAVPVIPDCFLSTMENNVIHTSELKVYPNPSVSVFNVQFNETVNGNVAVFDCTGQLVSAEKITGSRSASVNLEDCAPGIYFMHVQNNGASETVKLIKQ